MKHGLGTEFYTDGSKYDGMFKKGQKNGDGTYYLSDGAVYTGRWVEGKI
jgi:hypothetical protein